MKRSRWIHALAILVLATALVAFNLPPSATHGPQAPVSTPSSMDSTAQGSPDSPVFAGSATSAASSAFHYIDSTPQGDSEAIPSDDAIPSGCEPGQRLDDFTIECMDGSAFTLSAFRGKVVVINLWATWCTPCVNELPHFDRLQRERPDEVSVLAVHSDLITDDVAQYLSHYNYGICFAVDISGALITAVNGSTMLPQTVIIDPSGIVTYNQVGSVTFEALSQRVDEALAR